MSVDVSLAIAEGSSDETQKRIKACYETIKATLQRHSDFRGKFSAHDEHAVFEATKDNKSTVLKHVHRIIEYKEGLIKGVNIHIKYHVNQPREIKVEVRPEAPINSWLVKGMLVLALIFAVSNVSAILPFGQRTTKIGAWMEFFIALAVQLPFYFLLKVFFNQRSANLADAMVLSLSLACKISPEYFPVATGDFDAVLVSLCWDYRFSV